MSKQITPLADGRYELRYTGQIVGHAATEAEARETLNTIVYDVEHGAPLPTVYDPAYWNIRTPIATLSNGDTVYGGYDADGSNYGVHWEGEDGHFSAHADNLGGTWAGVPFDLNPMQVAKLRKLFTGNTTGLLIELAEMWTGEEWDGAGEEDKIPDPVTFQAMMRGTFVLHAALRAKFTDEQTNAIIIAALEVMEHNLGVIAYQELPVLGAIWDANHPEEAARLRAETEKEATAPQAEESQDPYKAGYAAGRRDLLNTMIFHIEQSIEGTASEEVQDGILTGLENAAAELRSRAA